MTRMPPTQGWIRTGLVLLPSARVTDRPVGAVTTRPPEATVPVWVSLTKAYLPTRLRSPKPSMPVPLLPAHGARRPKEASPSRKVFSKPIDAAIDVESIAEPLHAVEVVERGEDAVGRPGRFVLGDLERAAVRRPASPWRRHREDSARWRPGRSRGGRRSSGGRRGERAGPRFAARGGRRVGGGGSGAATATVPPSAPPVVGAGSDARTGIEAGPGVPIPLEGIDDEGKPGMKQPGT